MAGWARISQHRWQYDPEDVGDGSRNYLARNGDKVIELHVSGNTATFHNYVGEIMAEDNPLSGLAWRNSEERTMPASIGHEAAWALLDEQLQR